MRDRAWCRRAAGIWTLALSLVLLSDSCKGKKEPSSVSRFPADLADKRVAPSGVYEDGWAAPTASLTLYEPEGAQLVVVRGMVPKIAREDFQTDLELRVDGEPVAKRSLQLGEFTLEARISSSPGKRRMGLAFSASQQLPAGDGRVIGARLTYVGFERPAARKPGSGAEIVERGAGVQLGAGWYPLETFKEETFRWVNNDAQIIVSGAPHGGRRLALTLEPGPGLQGRPFTLKVLDETGRQVDAVEVAGRKTAEVFLPVEPSQEGSFRLHVDGGGRPSANKDPRIMNFRVLEINGPEPQ